MNEHDFLQALTDIDDDLIEDAGHRRHPFLWLRLGAVAAALVLLAVGAALFPWGGSQIPVVGEDPDSSLTDNTDDETGDPTAGTEATNATTTGTLTIPDASMHDTTGTQTIPDASMHDATGTTVGATEAGTTSKKGTLAQKKTTAKKWTDSPPAATTTTKGEVAIILKWEDKTLTQKFPEAEWNNATYAISSNAVNKEQAKEKLATITVTGQDVYTDKIYTHSVTLYALDGINPACAVAVQYAGDDTLYPARNFRYVPKTLGQFIDDLSLRENLSVGEVYYTYTDEEGNRHETVYEHLATDTVWEMLLDDTSLKNVYDQQIPYYHDIGISVHVPVVGQRNVSLALTEDGHIITNILDTGKAFYIGQDKVQTFIAYVTEHCALKWEHVYERTLATTAGDGGDADGETVTATTSKASKKPE